MKLIFDFPFFHSPIEDWWDKGEPDQQQKDRECQYRHPIEFRLDLARSLDVFKSKEQRDISLNSFQGILEIISWAGFVKTDPAHKFFILHRAELVDCCCHCVDQVILICWIFYALTKKPEFVEAYPRQWVVVHKIIGVFRVEIEGAILWYKFLHTYYIQNDKL